MDVRLSSPVLDLGCGEGAFAAELRQVLKKDISFTGLDMSEKALQTARATAGGLYESLHQGDARKLPFPDSRFGTVVANDAFVAVTPGLDLSLKETARVIRPGGHLYCTVATDRFGEHALWTRILRSVGAPGWADNYADRLRRRLTCFNYFTPDGWSSLLTDAGFEVEKMIGFFPLRHEDIWGFLTWTPLRALSVFRYIENEAARKLMARALMRAFQRRYKETPVHNDVNECSYILIRAVKS